MIQTIDLSAWNTNTTVKQAAQTAKSADFQEVLTSASASETALGTEKTSMDAIFEKASSTYQVPVNLIKAIAKTESNFNADAVSHCGAQGVMQLMPSTAAYLGVTDAFDAEQNIMGGTKYISQMLQMYDGDVKTALAAYNAGAGNVAKYGGIPPFKETQAYVEKVMEYMGEDFSISQTVPETERKAETPLIFVPKGEAASFTYDDYLRFMDLYREEMARSQIQKIYQNYLE